MTTVVTVTDSSTPFAYITVQLGIETFALSNSYSLTAYEKKRFYQRRIEKDSDDVIVIVEAAYLEEGRFSVSELRKFFPNSKVVVLGSDTFYHIHRGTRQFQGLEDCDIFLDLMESCAAEYSRYTTTDTWNWTTTRPLNNYLLKFAEENKHIVPDTDFISVLGKHTLERGYRKKMVDFIRESGLTFTRGDSDGYHDQDMDKLYRSYLRCRYTLGTSSHDNGMRSQKGFRNEIGPLNSRLLITDSFLDTVNQYKDIGIYYDYDDLNTIVNIIKEYPYGSDQYKKKAEEQKEWVVNNTIEKQLKNIFVKHGIF